MRSLKKINEQTYLAVILCAGLLFSAIPAHPVNKSIKKPSTHSKVIKKTSSKKLTKDVSSSGTTFTPTLFLQFKGNNPSLPWLYDQEILKRRHQITGSHRMVLESWWKTNLESFYLTDRTTNQITIRPKVNTKFLTRFYPYLYAVVEFQLLTGSGSIQEIFQRVGEINGVRHREIFFLWSATDWLAIKTGAINQKFLNAPLLMANNPFLSIVESMSFVTNNYNDIDLKFQQSIPNTLSDSNSIYTQGITKIPFFITHSLTWDYHPKSFYTVKTYGTFFYFHSLPNNIAEISTAYGNTPIEGDLSEFKYNYTGYYIAIEPVFHLFPNMEVQLKAHYIRNIKVTEENLSAGGLYGIQVPFDLTENIRLTPSFEYFINQPDSSVAYYNSERYGHNNRKGAAIQVTLNLYDRNIEIGLRYMNASSLREQAVIQEQDYFLFFFRTNYAKI